MAEINFLILEKTFENFLKRRFRCLKEIFEENVTNRLRKYFYQKDAEYRSDHSQGVRVP